MGETTDKEAIASVLDDHNTPRCEENHLHLYITTTKELIINHLKKHEANLIHTTATASRIISLPATTPMDHSSIWTSIEQDTSSSHLTNPHGDTDTGDPGAEVPLNKASWNRPFSVDTALDAWYAHVFPGTKTVQ